jgi:lipopolysaccharide export LptBFGC system permease protein LptF
MAKIIIFYMAREWTVWFLGWLFFLVGTIFMFSVLEDASQVFPRGMNQWREDLWFWLIDYLPWLLPICCLGASLFSISFARKRGEWAAMITSGISPIQSFLLIIVLGISIGWMSDWLLHSSGIRAIGENFEKVRSLQMKVGTNRLWFFQSFNPKTLTGNDLQLFSYGDGGEDLFRVSAKRATWNPSSGWIFFEGRFLGFYSSKGLPTLNSEGTSLLWESYNPTEENTSYHTKSPGIHSRFEKLSGLNLMDDPIPYLWLHKKAKEMTSAELVYLLDQMPNSLGHELLPYQIRKAQLWWNGPACLLALLIGLSMGSSIRSSTPAKLAGVSLVGALIFYLLRSLCISLAEQGILSPVTSASLPFITLFFWAILFARLQK